MIIIIRGEPSVNHIFQTIYHHDISRFQIGYHYNGIKLTITRSTISDTMLDGETGVKFPEHCSQRTHNWRPYNRRRVTLFNKYFHQKNKNNNKTKTDNLTTDGG